MLGKPPVGLLIGAVKDEIDKIKTGQQSRREIDVLGNGQVGVVTTADRVGGGQNTCPGVESGDDTSLGHGHSLLLHDFVQDRAGGFRHLVELVNAADTAVGEDERTRLEDELARLRITGDVRGQTDGRRTLSARVDAARGDLVHVGQHLRLRCRRVTAEQDVDIATVLGAGTLLESLVGWDGC